MGAWGGMEWAVISVRAMQLRYYFIIVTNIKYVYIYIYIYVSLPLPHSTRLYAPHWALTYT